jgi:hypothetical protein
MRDAAAAAALLLRALRVVPRGSHGEPGSGRPHGLQEGHPQHAAGGALVHAHSDATRMPIPCRKRERLCGHNDTHARHVRGAPVVVARRKVCLMSTHVYPTCSVVMLSIGLSHMCTWACPAGDEVSL